MANTNPSPQSLKCQCLHTYIFILFKENQRKNNTNITANLAIKWVDKLRDLELSLLWEVLYTVLFWENHYCFGVKYTYKEQVQIQSGIHTRICSLDSNIQFYCILLFSVCIHGHFLWRCKTGKGSSLTTSEEQSELDPMEHEIRPSLC